MKIKLLDFMYNGHHYTEWEAELPQRNEVDELFLRKIGDYIDDGLQQMNQEEES